MWTHLAFLLFVALAVYAQSLTGFALALILLGFVGLTDIVPLTDAVNAATFIVFATACFVFYHQYPVHLDWRIWPALASSFIFTAVGIFLLVWLASTVYQVLNLLLGISILATALLLFRSTTPQKATSSRFTFIVTGALSGLLGGIFSAPGPPLVYLVYRQPWPQQKIRQSLIFFFGISSLVRLLLVLLTSGYSPLALQLAAESIPVVFFASAAAARGTPIPPRLLKLFVCLLLILTGVGIIGNSLLTIIDVHDRTD